MTVQNMLDLLAPFVRTLPRFMGLAEAVLRQAADLQAVIPEMVGAFSLESAVGCQLDQIGQMFGLRREMTTAGSATTDEAFRSFLKAKLALWRWDGRNETVGAVIQEAFPGLGVKVKDNGNGSVTVTGAGSLPAAAGTVLPVPVGIRVNT